MSHVIVTTIEELHHVLIIQGVVDRTPGPARSYQAQHPQNPEVVRRRRLTYIEELGDVVDAEFLPRQKVQDPHTSGIAERLERLRHSAYHLCGW